LVIEREKESFKLGNINGGLCRLVFKSSVCGSVQKSKEKPVLQNIQELCHFEKRNGGAGGGRHSRQLASRVLFVGLEIRDPRDPIRSVPFHTDPIGWQKNQFKKLISFHIAARKIAMTHQKNKFKMEIT